MSIEKGDDYFSIAVELKSGRGSRRKFQNLIGFPQALFFFTNAASDQRLCRFLKRRGQRRDRLLFLKTQLHSVDF